MSSVFKGWRIKVGILILAVALVFMTGWIRSRSTSDMLMYPAGKNTIGCLVSATGSLVWQTTKMAPQPAELENVVWIGPTSPTWQTSPISGDSGNDDSGLKWRWWGFGVSESPPEATEEVGMSTTFVFIPYWSIVIPMTLISAYLLIQPRSGERKRIENDDAVQNCQFNVSKTSKNAASTVKQT